jgi:TonB family protein
MDRLQKKCVLVSTGIHLLPALILVVGPAFVSSKGKPDEIPVLEFVPFITTDALVSGGGSRNAPPPPPLPAPPPAQPPQPAMATPPPAPPPERIRPPASQPKTEPASSEPAFDPRARKIETSSTLVSRADDTQAQAKAKADAAAREQAKAAAERARLAREFNEAAKRIGTGVSGATTIELPPPGPGGGGVPYANFYQAVKSVYANAWIVPDGVTDDEATVGASVTIARNGAVISWRITQRSGSAAVDQSVQATLDRVRYAAPLPEGAKEEQRTVTINFNLRAKRGLG